MGEEVKPQNQWQKHTIHLFRENPNVINTCDCALILAPSLTRTLTTSACPASDAMWRAVFPFWFNKTERIENITGFQIV